MSPRANHCGICRSRSIKHILKLRERWRWAVCSTCGKVSTTSEEEWRLSWAPFSKLCRREKSLRPGSYQATISCLSNSLGTIPTELSRPLNPSTEPETFTSLLVLFLQKQVSISPSFVRLYLNWISFPLIWFTWLISYIRIRSVVFTHIY